MKIAKVIHDFLFLVSRRNPRTKLVLKSKESIKREIERQLKMDKFVIHPFSAFRSFWDLLMVCIIYLLTVLEPFGLSFEYIDDNIALPAGGWTMMVYCMNFIVAVDIVLNFFTGFYDDASKKIILNRNEIIINYTLTLLTNHMVFAIPWYLLARTRESINHHVSMDQFELDMRDWFTIASVTRIIRFNEITNYLWVFKRLSIHYKMVFEVLNLFIYSSVMFHYATCFQISVVGLAQSQIFRDLQQFDNLSWVVQEDFISTYQGNLLGQYAKCFYRAVSCLLLQDDAVAVNLTVEDRGLTCILRMIGVLHALFFVSCSLRILRSLYTPMRRVQDLDSFTTDLLRNKDIPKKKEKRIKDFLRYKYDNNRFYNEKKALSLLSETLKAEVNEFCARRFIESVAIFRNLPNNVITSFLKYIKDDLFLKGDVMIRADTAGYCMYFLSVGTLSVVDSGGRVLSHLIDGAYFGELTLLFENVKRCVSLVAVEPCELMVLKKNEFRAAMLKYPEYLEAMRRYALANMPLTEFVKSEYTDSVVIEVISEEVKDSKP